MYWSFGGRDFLGPNIVKWSKHLAIVCGFNLNCNIKTHITSVANLDTVVGTDGLVIFLFLYKMKNDIQN